MQVYNFYSLLPLAIRFVLSSFAFIAAHAKKTAFAKTVFTTEATTVINEYQIQSRGGNMRNGYIIDCLQTYIKISTLRCFHLCQQITCQRSCEVFYSTCLQSESCVRAPGVAFLFKKPPILTGCPD